VGAAGPHQLADHSAPSCSGNCPIAASANLANSGSGPRACPFHDFGAMIFDGPLADVEITAIFLLDGCYDPLHDVMLTMGKTPRRLSAASRNPNIFRISSLFRGRRGTRYTSAQSLFNGPLARKRQQPLRPRLELKASFAREPGRVVLAGDRGTFVVLRCAMQPPNKARQSN